VKESGKVFELCLSSPQSIKKNFVWKSVELCGIVWILCTDHGFTVGIRALKCPVNGGLNPRNGVPRWGLRPLTVTHYIAHLDSHYIVNSPHYMQSSLTHYIAH
jgi:hypothetical protein